MDENNRYIKGLDNLNRIDGEQGQLVIDSLSGMTEDIGRYIIEFAFGDIYDRRTLDLKQREMITITSLLSQGGTENQLRVHINGSLNVGLSKEEVIEIFIQCIPYVGFPRVLNATNIALEIFAGK